MKRKLFREKVKNRGGFSIVEVVVGLTVVVMVTAAALSVILASVQMEAKYLNETTALCACESVVACVRFADNTDELAAVLENLTEEPAVQEDGAEMPVDFFPGYTDTAVIAGTVGNFNCMSFGPGSLDVCHKPNEFVPCDEITRSVNVMTELAKDILL